MSKVYQPHLMHLVRFSFLFIVLAVIIRVVFSVNLGPILFLGFTLLIFWTHRANLARLFSGTEPRVGAAKHG